MKASSASPRVLARVTGALYLYIMAAAMFAEAFVRDRLIVAGDAAATAHNILASEQLYRLGVAADISITACDVAVAALLYILLRPAGATLSLLAASFRLAYSAAMTLNAAFLIGPLLLLTGDGIRALRFSRSRRSRCTRCACTARVSMQRLCCSAFTSCSRDC